MSSTHFKEHNALHTVDEHVCTAFQNVKVLVWQNVYMFQSVVFHN